jgi:hypothetical protein
MRQYVAAQKPSKTNAFTARLTAIVAHVNNLMEVLICTLRLCFTNVTIAITVVTGVTKRNQRADISERFKGNQCGMRRSIGNTNRNATNPSKTGKHHGSEYQSLPCTNLSSESIFSGCPAAWHSNSLMASMVPGILFIAMPALALWARRLPSTDK